MSLLNLLICMILIEISQSHGAMENWGLVTYRTTAVLFDEENSDEKYKNRVAYVVAHELAHQWFGNLVTMDWWSEVREALNMTSP
jgi:aminopeptidase N